MQQVRETIFVAAAIVTIEVARVRLENAPKYAFEMPKYRDDLVALRGHLILVCDDLSVSVYRR